MKKKLLSLVAIAMLLSTNSYAQLSIGGQAGLNLASMNVRDNDGSYNDDNSMLIGFNVGAMLNAQMSDMFSLRTGLSFSQKGVKSEGFYESTYSFGGTTTTTRTEYTSKVTPGYLEIPIALRANLALGDANLFFEAGPYIGFGIAGKYSSESTTTTTTDDGTNTATTTETDSSTESIKWGSDETEDDFKPFDFGVYPAVGLRFGNFEVSAAYKLGLANISTYTDNGYTITNNVINFSIGYWFGMD